MNTREKKVVRLSVSRKVAGVVVQCVVAVVLFAVMLSPADASELRMYAGAGLRQPIDVIVDDFQKKTGHVVVIDYDGSGRLLAKLKLSGQGDLLIPGEAGYIDKLPAGFVNSRRSVAERLPVIAVSLSSPGNAAITALADLVQPGIRVGLGDPQAMALGKTAAMILERSGLQENILDNTVVFAATVKQLALYVAEGAVDAAIVGRPDALQFQEQVRTVAISPEFYEPDSIAVAVLNTTVDLQAACALRDFLAAPAAQDVFVKFGFEPIIVHQMP